MRLLKSIAELVFWMGLWICIPAALLYPVALWLAKHAQVSVLVLGRSYIYAVGAWFLPPGLLVDWIYRRFFRGQRPELRPEAGEPSN